MSTQGKKRDSTKQSEKQAVYTTIVGGRPPGSGTSIGIAPRGIEVLVKKASVDKKFKRILLQNYTAAAKEINLELTSAETAILANITSEQLEAIINKTKVNPENRRAFLGKAASVMLIALGTQSLLCCEVRMSMRTLGIQPDSTDTKISDKPDLPDTNLHIGPFPPKIPPEGRLEQFKSIKSEDFKVCYTLGIQPDRPPQAEDVQIKQFNKPYPYLPNLDESNDLASGYPKIITSRGIQPDRPSKEIKIVKPRPQGFSTEKEE